MKEQINKEANRLRRKSRIRATVSGTTERPRMSVFISGQHVSVQLIDDSKGVTVVAASSIGQKLTGTLTEKAVHVGELIAKKAEKAKVKKVVFDRNGRRYHGRIKALADSARKQGLEF